MKISIRHRRTYSLAVLCALTSVFLILYGCGDDDNGGGGPPIAGPYSISGQVTSIGIGLSGVTMALSGASSATTTTDTSGNYSFTGLDNGSYSITPSSTGFTFSPVNSPQTVSGGDLLGVNFTATWIVSAQIVTCPPSGTTNVTIQDFSFTPDNVTIGPRGIVKWTNNGPSLHTVTAGFLSFPTGPFDSDDLGTGATFCVQYFAPGPHPYFCTIHPSMVGLVTVTSGDWDY